MRNVVMVAVASILLAGCGAGAAATPGTAPSPVPTPTVTVRHGDKDAPAFRPKPFLVRYGDTQLELQPYTYCWSDASSAGCADGVDHDPPVIGSPTEIFVFVPVAQFNQLVVTQQAEEDDAGRAVEADNLRLDDGWWQVRPSGPAGSYRVSIFAANGETSTGGSGDMVADVVWTIDLDR